MRIGVFQGLPAAALGMLAYVLLLGPMQSLPRAQGEDVLRVVLPGYIEVLLAAGDRHLAANIGVFRSMMVGGGVKEALTYEVQAKIQSQVAIMNPRQEDNSYVAAAILPWWDQVDRAQFILARSTEARDWDYMPPFFQAFNEYYFNKDYKRAGDLVQIAAARSTGVNRESLKDVAAKWYTLGDDPRAAIGIISALKEASRDVGIQQRLQGRIDRLNALLELRMAAQHYYQDHDEPLLEVVQLQQLGYLERIPVDPFQFGYELDNNGQVQLRSGRQK